MLRGTATVNVNAVVWITSLKNDDERQSTKQVLTFLEPFLRAINVPFEEIEPKTAAELFEYLEHLVERARAGLRPIIHFDTHGDLEGGLTISASSDDVPWKEIVKRLRPINIAAQNNVCVVSAACCGMQTIMSLDFNEPTPFFLMFAPEDEVTFGFIEANMHNFYEAVFTSGDIMRAHERHLAPNLQQYHCQRMLLKALSGSIRDGYIGNGRRKQVRAIVKRKIGPGRQHPDTQENRRLARRTALAFYRPSQDFIDRYAKPFLMGQTLPFKFEEIPSFERMSWKGMFVGGVLRGHGDKIAAHSIRAASVCAR